MLLGSTARIFMAKQIRYSYPMNIDPTDSCVSLPYAQNKEIIGNWQLVFGNLNRVLAEGNIFRFESLVIDPLLQFLAGLEKWKFLRFDSNLFAGLGIPASVGSFFLNEKGAQSPESTRSPFASALAIPLKKISTIAEVCGLVRLVASFKA